jgi:glycosyltransferase involved in cell wall biosynthesis
MTMAKKTAETKIRLEKMMNNDRKIKVLLCLNGDKDTNKPLIDRAGVLLRYALESAGIEYTYDFHEAFDLVHLLSLNQYKAFQNVPTKALINKKAPVVVSLFNDFNDFKDELSESDEDFQNQVLKAFKPIKANLILCNWNAQMLILKHLNIFKTVNLVNIGARSYDQDTYSETEKKAFRKYYGVGEKAKIIIGYGEYSYDKGLDTMEALSRIMPEYEFFYFGGKTGIFSNPKHYEKNNDIPNLHYEAHVPEELYHSAIMNATAAFVPFKYHVDSVYLLELMKAGVPIVSSPNPFLYDMLVKDKTALLGESVEEYFHLLKNIKKVNCAEGAKEFAAQFTPETYGKRLKEVYSRLIIANSEKSV